MQHLFTLYDLWSRRDGGTCCAPRSSHPVTSWERCTLCTTSPSEIRAATWWRMADRVLKRIARENVKVSLSLPLDLPLRVLKRVTGALDRGDGSTPWWYKGAARQSANLLPPRTWPYKQLRGVSFFSWIVHTRSSTSILSNSMQETERQKLLKAPF